MTSFTDSIGLTSYGEQEAAIRKGMAYLEGLTPPELAALDLEQVGELSPELARAISAEGTAFEDVYVDPRLKQAQQDALEQLQGIAEAEGLTAQDKALLSRIARQERTQERGQREAIIQQAQQRGIAGSGLELMQQMQAQQDAATRQSIRDQEIAALAEQRKLEALQQAGQLGGQMRSQEFGEQAQIAQARDLMERFNLANQQQVELTNVGARNQAQQYNLAVAQDIANREAQSRYELPQQDWANRMTLAQAKAGVQSGYAQMLGQQSGANMQMLGSAAIAAAASDVNVKKNIEMAPDEIDNFLNELTGYKFSYKEPEKYGEGERLGVMAQDMEKSELGDKAVFKNQEGTKMIDGADALGSILASLGRLNEKVNALEEENGR